VSLSLSVYSTAESDAGIRAAAEQMQRNERYNNLFGSDEAARGFVPTESRKLTPEESKAEEEQEARKLAIYTAKFERESKRETTMFIAIFAGTFLIGIPYLYWKYRKGE
jgi:hypothetical protein